MLQKIKIDIIIKKNLFFVIIMSLILVKLNSAWLENIPTLLTQPDMVQISAFQSGDEFHNWVHDEEFYTIIQDDVT
ncbi:MAG: hypothetical protein FWG98_05270, partial [Candidatus Cloacimonetes bacterium]|nr:hypothetical protein [Candidatus Cloacimonadota bacterium]